MIKALSLNPACIKTLSAVEAEPNRSNQHELNGVVQLKSILGLSRQSFDARFSIRGQDGYVASSVTWYDARESHPTRSEYRLYFQTNEVMNRAQEGSTLILGLDASGGFWIELIV
ncbi:type II restriction endonuclease [Vibrio sp. 1F263]|uniref:type II restriction endonuclease n=1 Tax=Vibrio sp. 1F263 TaxID=3230012 RepID=UPI00352D6BFB